MASPHPHPLGGWTSSPDRSPAAVAALTPRSTASHRTVSYSDNGGASGSSSRSSSSSSSSDESEDSGGGSGGGQLRAVRPPQEEEEEEERGPDAPAAAAKCAAAVAALRELLSKTILPGLGGTKLPAAEAARVEASFAAALAASEASAEAAARRREALGLSPRRRAATPEGAAAKAAATEAARAAHLALLRARLEVERLDRWLTCMRASEALAAARAVVPAAAAAEPFARLERLAAAEAAARAAAHALRQTQRWFAGLPRAAFLPLPGGSDSGGGAPSPGANGCAASPSQAEQAAAADLFEARDAISDAIKALADAVLAGSSSSSSSPYAAVEPQDVAAAKARAAAAASAGAGAGPAAAASALAAAAAEIRLLRAQLRRGGASLDERWAEDPDRQLKLLSWNADVCVAAPTGHDFALKAANLTHLLVRHGVDVAVLQEAGAPGYASALRRALAGEAPRRLPAFAHVADAPCARCACRHCACVWEVAEVCTGSQGESCVLVWDARRVEVTAPRLLDCGPGSFGRAPAVAELTVRGRIGDRAAPRLVLVSLHLAAGLADARREAQRVGGHQLMSALIRQYGEQAATGRTILLGDMNLAPMASAGMGPDPGAAFDELRAWGFVAVNTCPTNHAGDQCLDTCFLPRRLLSASDGSAVQEDALSDLAAVIDLKEEDSKLRPAEATDVRTGAGAPYEPGASAAKAFSHLAGWSDHRPLLLACDLAAQKAQFALTLLERLLTRYVALTVRPAAAKSDRLAIKAFAAGFNGWLDSRFRYERATASLAPAARVFAAAAPAAPSFGRREVQRALAGALFLGEAYPARDGGWARAFQPKHAFETIINKSVSEWKGLGPIGGPPERPAAAARKFRVNI